MYHTLQSVAQRVVPSGGQVWLYGSRARGESRDDSDWDLLILLNTQKAGTEEFNEIAYPFVQAGWMQNSDINPQIYTFEEWEKRHFTPYYINVENDKIRVL